MAEILIVDDEIGVRELLTEVLQDEGHSVILAANGALAARVGCQPEQLQAEPLTSLLASGHLLPPQFEEVLRCGVQGVTLASSHLDIPWRSGAVERVEVRVSQNNGGKNTALFSKSTSYRL